VIPRSILISLVVGGVDLFRDQSLPYRCRAVEGIRPRPKIRRRRWLRCSWKKSMGSKTAAVFTLMVLWTAVGNRFFALMLGYSRIPYAARPGTADFFLRFLAALHPTKNFPHVSLLVIGAHLDRLQFPSPHDCDRRVV